MNVWTISRGGVYDHHEDGVWVSLDEAIAASTELAQHDGYFPSNAPDGYHVWTVRRTDLDTGETVEEGQVEFKDKAFRRDGEWHPASGLMFTLATPEDEE